MTRINKTLHRIKELNMAKYDDASWHYGGDFPSELPIENGGTHIGLFLAWCIDNNLISQFQIEESSADINLVLQRKITGRDFFLTNCDEKFTSEDLNELGNSFAEDYYVDEGEFAKRSCSYLQDFSNVAEGYFESTGQNGKTVYHLEDTWDFYDVFKEIIDIRFAQWKKFRNIE
jgi:hypothetical protein